VRQKEKLAAVGDELVLDLHQPLFVEGAADLSAH